MTTLIDATQAQMGDFRMDLQSAKVLYIDQVVNAHMDGKIDALTPLMSASEPPEQLLSDALYKEMPDDKAYVAELLENLLVEHFDQAVERMASVQQNAESMMFTSLVDFNPANQTFAPFSIGPLEPSQSYDPEEPLQTLGLGPHKSTMSQAPR
tara:strand:+ start:235 stop:693 length:459 start_codon:yes stop_codon:yes gene_type:complete